MIGIILEKITSDVLDIIKINFSKFLKNVSLIFLNLINKSCDSSYQKRGGE